MGNGICSDKTIDKKKSSPVIIPDMMPAGFNVSLLALLLNLLGYIAEWSLFSLQIHSRAGLGHTQQVD
jgi:hypothetical protein